MVEQRRKRGRERVYDAERTRAVILNAAEVVFAEHGYAGTTVDAIAAEAGYNKSLLFQYFGDKLGLYTEVLKRADQETSELLKSALSSSQLNDVATIDADRFQAFLERMAQNIFDYLLEHPRLVRILTWEMADSWQTFKRITSHFPPEDTNQFAKLFHRASSSGIIRSDFFPTIQLSMMMQVCQIYLAYLPLYQQLLPEGDLSSTHTIAMGRQYLIDFVVAGMMNVTYKKSEKGF